MARKSEPIKILKRLLEAPMESEFAFIVEKNKGKKILHRVRVELSRARELCRAQNIIPKHFKILLLRIENHAEDVKKEKVVIKKTKSAGDMSEEMAEILIAAGHVKKVEAV